MVMTIAIFNSSVANLPLDLTHYSTCDD